MARSRSVSSRPSRRRRFVSRRRRAGRTVRSLDFVFEDDRQLAANLVRGSSPKRSKSSRCPRFPAGEAMNRSISARSSCRSRPWDGSRSAKTRRRFDSRRSTAKACRSPISKGNTSCSSSGQPGANLASMRFPTFKNCTPTSPRTTVWRSSASASMRRSTHQEVRRATEIVLDSRLSRRLGAYQIPGLYGVESIPATFLIDPNGKVAAVNRGNGSLKDEVDAALGR